MEMIFKYGWYFCCAAQWSPWQTIPLQKGVRQGYPLSPLLFVLAAGLLQFVFNEAMNYHIIQVPLQSTSRTDYPMIQYANDTILVLPAEEM